MLSKLREGVDYVLTHLSEDEYSNEINKAFDIYKRPFNNFDLDIDIEHGFNQWLIHDYVTNKGKTLSELIEPDKKIGKALADSIYSVYRVISTKTGFVFKDIITSADYEVETESLFENGDIVSIRLYPFEGKYHLIDNPERYPNEMEISIRQSIMNKYNDYCSSNEPVGIYEFIKSNSQLVYHLTNIIHYYENEMLEEQTYVVYVAEYGIKERELLLDELLDTDYFQIIETYEDEMTLVLLDEGIQIGEVLITTNRLELEANSSTSLELCKDVLKKVAGERAVLIKEGELSIDDLLT